MTKVYVPSYLPSPLPEKRFATNDKVPSVSAFRRAAKMINYAATNLRKQIYAKSYDTLGTPAGQSTTVINDYFLFRTGENVDAIVAWVGMAPSDTTSAYASSVPRLKLRIVDSVPTTISSDYATHSSVNTGSYTPDEISWHKLVITTDDGLAANTVYRGYIDQEFYSRVHSISVYERGKPIANSSNTGVADPMAYKVEGPIYDADTQLLLEAGTTLWKHNACQLISWSHKSAATLTTVSSSTWTNLVSGSTSGYSATSAGFYLSTQYHNTLSQTTVPVQLAVYGLRASGTGNFSIRLVDSGGTEIEDLAITSTEINSNPCYVFSTTMNAQASSKVDVEIRSDDNSSVFRVHAVSLWEYDS